MKFTYLLIGVLITSQIFSAGEDFEKDMALSKFLDDVTDNRDNFLKIFNEMIDEGKKETENEKDQKSKALNTKLIAILEKERALFDTFSREIQALKKESDDLAEEMLELALKESAKAPEGAGAGAEKAKVAVAAVPAVQPQVAVARALTPEELKKQEEDLKLKYPGIAVAPAKVAIAVPAVAVPGQRAPAKVAVAVPAVAVASNLEDYYKKYPQIARAVAVSAEPVSGRAPAKVAVAVPAAPAKIAVAVPAVAVSAAPAKVAVAVVPAVTAGESRAAQGAGADLPAAPGGPKPDEEGQ